MPLTITEKAAETTIRIGYSIIDPDTGRVFNDALNFPKSEFDPLTKTQIRTLMQVRYQAWKDRLAAESAPKSETETYQEALADLTAQRAGIDQLIAETEAQIERVKYV